MAKRKHTPKAFYMEMPEPDRAALERVVKRARAAPGRSPTRAEVIRALVREADGEKKVVDC